MQTNDTDIRVGRNIRAARDRRGWSSAELAERITARYPDMQISDSSVRKFERGERVMPYSLIVRLSVVLDCAVQTLIDGTDPRHPLDRAAPAVAEFGILTDAEHAAFRYMATEWNGDRHALIIFNQLYMALPVRYRREAPLSLLAQTELALNDGAISMDQLPPDLDYLEQKWRMLYDL